MFTHKLKTQEALKTKQLSRKFGANTQSAAKPALDQCEAVGSLCLSYLVGIFVCSTEEWIKGLDYRVLPQVPLVMSQSVGYMYPKLV